MRITHISQSKEHAAMIIKVPHPSVQYLNCLMRCAFAVSCCAVNTHICALIRLYIYCSESTSGLCRDRRTADKLLAA